MWITKEMQQDIESKLTWVPIANSWITTLECLADALSEAGYDIEIKLVRVFDLIIWYGQV